MERKAIAVLLVGGLLVTGLIASSVDERDVTGSSREEIAALSTALPTIESMRVTIWHDQDWCQAIGYGRGEYLSMPEPDTNCEHFHAPIRLDRTAETDFGRIRQALRHAGFWPIAFHASYSPEGSIEFADFRFTSGTYHYSQSGVWPESEAFVIRVSKVWQWAPD